MPPLLWHICIFYTPQTNAKKYKRATNQPHHDIVKTYEQTTTEKNNEGITTKFSPTRRGWLSGV
jgi:hypothetical protein